MAIGYNFLWEDEMRDMMERDDYIKNDMIKSYESRIKQLQKEIINQNKTIDSLRCEVSRLKKQLKSLE